MEPTHSIKEKLRQFFIILFPILVTQVLLFSMTFFNTMMSGLAGPSDLAGVAIGSSLWIPVSTGLGGVFTVIIPTWGEQLKIGIPVGFSIFFETSIFAAVTLLMSAFDTATIATHQGAMNFASMIYMVPLSFSMVMTILVGFEAGAHRFRDARLYSRLGIVSSLVMAMLTAIILLSFREQIAGLYSKELKVIQLTQQFLVFALFFQFSDAVATPIQGILRGYKDVTVPFITSLVFYW